MEAVQEIAHSRYLRVYHLKGRFGWASDDFLATGNIQERISYKHITRHKLNRVCSSIQASYTKQMYLLSGVDPDSHEAYTLACSGLVCPATRYTSPVIYGVKCVDFRLPDFTLEIHAINTESYLLERLAHDIALTLKSAAVCTGLRRVRYGYFTLARSLVQQQ